MRKFYFFCLSLVTVNMMLSCKQREPAEEEETPVVVQTPVTITTVSNEPLNEYVELNATSTFLQNNYVKSNMTGYVKSVHVQLGQYTQTGQLLFTLKTKESEALGN